METPNITHEAVARWLYAAGTAGAATAISVEIGPTLKALLLAVAHVAAAAIVAYARRPRTVRVRRVKPRPRPKRPARR